MSKIKILIFLTVILTFNFLPFTTPVYANGAGLPAFFKVNGQLSKPNILQLYGITAQTFLIPQDFAPENYLVNSLINFEVDETPLYQVFPSQAFRNIKYSWDYGDGSKAQGLKNTHSYSKIGSYILVLDIDIYTEVDQPPTKFIDSFLLNIVPDLNFKYLPKAVIKVDGMRATNPNTREIDLSFSKKISFDSSLSTPKEGIIEYLWNFGDGTTSTGKSASHKYSDNSFKTVVLRVKDSNGFISDDFVGLQNTPPAKQDNSRRIYLGLAIAAVVLLGLFFIRFLKNRR